MEKVELRLYIQFAYSEAADAEHIRKWSSEPFEGAVEYVPATHLAAVKNEALEEAAKVAENDAAEVYPTNDANRRHLEACVSIATAIRAMKGDTHDPAR